MVNSGLESWAGISHNWQEVFWLLIKNQCMTNYQTDVGFRLAVKAIAYGFSGGYTWTSKNYYQSVWHVSYEDSYHSSFARFNVTPRLVIR